jgi:hypothetical protein
MSQLIATCQICGTRIESGHLGINTVALGEYREAVEQWNAANPVGAGTLGSLIDDHPEQVPWETHCDQCEPNTCGYCIQVDELRTAQDLLRWTSHLMGKAWLASTDWDELLEKVAAGTDTRLREVSP